MSFQRQDDAQRKNPAPTSPKLGEKFASGRPMRAKIPSRGKVLCVFSNPDHMVEIEPQVSGRGFSLLRARPGIHAYWLAITSRPDVIITDVDTPGPGTDSAYLLDCLHRNMKTRDVPVVAILNAKEQGEVENSGLQHASLCVHRDMPTDELLARVDGLIDTSQDRMREKYRRSDRGHTNQVDAVFSELGTNGSAETPVTPIPLLGPIRMPVTNSTPMPS